MRDKVYDEDMEEEIDVFDLEVSALMRPCANKRYLTIFIEVLFTLVFTV